MEGLYYLCSENKGADQLRGYREADLHLCFRICKSRFSHYEAHIICTMYDVRGDFLGPPHDTTPDAVEANKNSYFNDISEKDNGSYRGFGYLILISDPVYLAKRARGKYCNFANFNRSVD